MKRIILCILGCLLLVMWAGTAQAEECTHENLLMCGLTTETVDLEAGHQWVETKTCVCDDCSRKVVNRRYGEFVGHVFYMSESIHFEAEKMHLLVHICPACWHVTLTELLCLGEDQCERFTTSVGEIPPVQQGESWEEQKLLTDDDYIKRWIAQDRPDKPQ